ncbi:hypothetical protein [Desulfoluna spongiiphila]|uniref:hypothetical protein n=1 Tax=Desulfoluna spongiiphila TaxID=419481 RepID=UPI00125FC7BD|nr:hypothetical protein [Desulfoluna spongiiphila]
MEKPASGGQGMIPWTPGCECAFPFVPQGKSHSPLNQVELNLFLKPVYQTGLYKSGKSLALGRVTEGTFNRVASGGEVCHLESKLRICI